MAGAGENTHEGAGPRKPFFSGGAAEVTGSYGAGAIGPGVQVGPFKLLGILGEGGYGIVYLAAQEQPIRRRVALKVIKPGMDSKQVIARFEAERQALALLDHPNIAQIHDAGTTPEGRPYFAMEYIEGLPITEYCDREKLSLKERLQLFLQVCEAVRHAHQKGIIHRDLKPSNMLVTAQNDRPLVKVIDFGIAKALAQPLTAKTLYTEQGQFLGTPDYMSPEQAEMDARGVDTRSDVYSLGVVLYELLTGVLPFDPDALRAGGVEHIRAVIRDEEPRTPSTRLTGQGDEMMKIAQRRRTDPQTLTRSLHRELEWIPLKAMRKESSRRYQSVSELADDIENYRSGAPLLAGPESVVYRGRKFAQRHAGAVAAITAIAVLSFLGFVVTTALYLRSERATETANERSESYRRVLYGSRIALAQSAHRTGRISQVSRQLALCPDDLRGWEWDWLSYISDEADLTLKGYPKYKFVKEIQSIVVSPDGKRVFAAGVKGGVQVWDLESRSAVMTFMVGIWINSVALDPAGRRLVSGTVGGAVEIWDAETGDRLMTLQEGIEPRWGLIEEMRETNQVFSVAFTPDGKWVAAGGEDRTIKVWDGATGDERMVLRGHADSIRGLACSPDGRRMASASADKTIKLWDIATGNEVMALTGHTEAISSVAFTRDSRRIVSGSDDRTIRLWNADTGDHIRTFYGHQEGSIWSVAFSPDGRRIVSGSSDETVRVWDAATGAETGTLRGHRADVTCVVFSPDGKRVISGGYDQTIKVWNPAVSRERTTLYGHKGYVRSVSFSPDGGRLVSGGADATIKIWDIASACEVATLCGHTDGVWCVLFSPDGDRVVSASGDAQVKVWNTTTGNALMTLSGHAGCVYCVALSPDGKRIVSGGADRTIRIWDAATGRALMTLTGHEEAVTSIGFSPSGDRIVSVGLDGRAKLWDSVSGVELASIQAHAQHLRCAAFTPDGKQVVTGGGWTPEEQNARVWDVHSTEETMKLRGTAGVTSVVLTPDCKRIFTGGEVGLVMLWDMVSGSGIFTLRPNGRDVSSLAISPDGKTIAIGDSAGTITLLECAAPRDGFPPRLDATEARQIVDELYQECGSYEEVAVRVLADKTITGSVRRFAAQIARSRSRMVPKASD